MVKKVIFSFFLSLFMISFSFALELKSPIVLENSSEESLSISWDAVDWALGYYVYYNTSSFSEEEERSQIPRFIEETEAVIEWLKHNTEYYIAVSVINDIGEEGTLSDEVIFKTKKAKEESLSLISLSLNNKQELKATFNKVLDSSSDAEREFKIVKQDSKEEILIDSVQLSELKSVTIYLFEALETSEDYEITILAISDENGNTIESWIDGIALFTTPVSFENIEGENLLDWIGVEDLNSAPENKNSENQEEQDVNNQEDQNTEDSSEKSWQEEKKSDDSFEGNAGKNISQEEIDQLTLNAAKKSENLPQTWPESILLFMFACIIAFFVFYFQKKKVEDFK